jgi:hypothetical protein
MMLGGVLVAAPLLAQNPTGDINGRVTYEGGPLPGVTVTASSPSLQGGSKTAITNSNGDYLLRFLQAGEYEVTFALDTFQTLKFNVKVSVAQTRTIDAEMYPKEITEEITVTSAYETISSGTQSAVTYDKDMMENLPVPRTLNAAVLLTPGVHGTGPSGGITISGAMSYENLFLINGVVVNENVRGQAFNLFIEDAIEETTTSVSGVSAEYGRFSGGVVNTITRSGGNEFSGSYRLNLTNDDWVSATPRTTSQVDDINKVHEATLGGYIMKDRLWFFAAGRDTSFSTSRQFADDTAYNYTSAETRLEGKLTFSPHFSHRIVAAYTDIDSQQNNRGFFIPIDWSHIDPSRELPQTLLSLNYTGVITDNFFIEGQYSKRDMTFVDSGGEAKDDRIAGTPMRLYNYDAAVNAPFFCGSACGDEERNNENYLAKGSYFLSTGSLGTHDIVFGIDSFNDIRLSNNYQSASNYVLFNYNPLNYGDDGVFYPIITGEDEEMDVWPVLLASTGTDYTTNSFFINDTWRLNNKITLSVGARYDDNDGQDGSGATVADDSRISPRLGITWDIKGDGDWLVHASAARYVMAIANTVASSGGAGVPSWFGYAYLGPTINLDADGNPTQEYNTREVIQIMFNWFDSVGGLANTDLWYSSPSIRGVNTVVENLESPYTDEISIGLTKTLGSKGMLRADYVHREFGSFYMLQRDLTTGRVDWTGTPFPGVTLSESFDFGQVINDDSILRREYDGLHTQFQYRLSDNISIGGNWTWSHSRGNFDGETSGSGPITSGIMNYPEYTREEWSYDTGDLSIDQRHQVRAWFVWDIFSSAHHNLNLSWLENYYTGTPYGASANVYVDLTPYGYPSQYARFENPGYVNQPTYVSYRFFSRDAFRTDDIHHTDLALNYSFFWNLFGTELEVFIQPEIINLFNEDSVDNPNNTVYSSFFSFDPYTEEPIEGIDFERDENFGKDDSEGDFQTPRTFRISLGIRF